MANNKALRKADGAKQDEFYTQLSDIEKELKHYKKHFSEKTVLCNCDDPFESDFFKYFVLNFNRLGYEYLITGDERAVLMRAFPESDKLIMYERQNHKCAICGKEKQYNEMHGDHIIAWSKGGRTTIENGQMLCTECNLRKGSL